MATPPPCLAHHPARRSSVHTGHGCLIPAAPGCTCEPDPPNHTDRWRGPSSQLRTAITSNRVSCFTGTVQKPVSSTSRVRLTPALTHRTARTRGRAGVIRELVTKNLREGEGGHREVGRPSTRPVHMGTGSRAGARDGNPEVHGRQPRAVRQRLSLLVPWPLPCATRHFPRITSGY